MESWGAIDLAKTISSIVPERCDMTRQIETQMRMDERWKGLAEQINIRTVSPGVLERSGLKVVCMSDTHSAQEDIEFGIPDGDIFIHAGDFTRYNT